LERRDEDGKGDVGSRCGVAAIPGAGTGDRAAPGALDPTAALDRIGADGDGRSRRDEAATRLVDGMAKRFERLDANGDDAGARAGCDAMAARCSRRLETDGDCVGDAR
jgi:hypothetical protein